ncbi:alpha/beta fold hydrolase [Umezawaea tangerina]|uniref:2-succinyl-6-hydroxy-2, 4-cyclohexadiene-1-carboxylate synthase n=1 Tax=Umezawaea tangerina TaxID=84725 RepID=A0A2T0T1B0_9PSEU|nr:alpha/beta hydrolase [Umezawaea tangerina]PRY39452.1 2-succinyl-6-hydroxy-2,4-cyclohexadiene-1-carboxylate synthase [Umezawaea tangerina]
MPIDDVRTGPPVLLLPGGAEACEGFFPGLPEGLAADPGCRVVVHDRPGTGTSAAAGSLAGAAAHLARLIDELDSGPVVLAGQSLGGAVAVLLAAAHPEKVAGLVLIDPTPVNDPRVCSRLERSMRAVGALASVPGVGRLLSAALGAATRRTARRLRLRPDCAAALVRTGGADLRKLAAAVRGITALSEGLREADLPRVPAVVVTADRAPDSVVRRAHTRLAAAFGTEVVCWPGATHSAHLDHPDETLAAVRDVVARART